MQLNVLECLTQILLGCLLVLSFLVCKVSRVYDLSQRSSESCSLNFFNIYIFFITCKSVDYVTIYLHNLIKPLENFPPFNVFSVFCLHCCNKKLADLACHTHSLIDCNYELCQVCQFSLPTWYKLQHSPLQIYQIQQLKAFCCLVFP